MIDLIIIGVFIIDIIATVVSIRVNKELNNSYQALNNYMSNKDNMVNEIAKKIEEDINNRK